MTEATPKSYAIFDEKFIITANIDGSIPLNSKIVVELPKGGVQLDLCADLVHRVNTQPELLAVLAEMEEWAVNIIDEDSRVPMDIRERARQVIAKATGPVS